MRQVFMCSVFYARRRLLFHACVVHSSECIVFLWMLKNVSFVSSAVVVFVRPNRPLINYSQIVSQVKQSRSRWSVNVRWRCSKSVKKNHDCGHWADDVKQ